MNWFDSFPSLLVQMVILLGFLILEVYLLIN